MKLYVQNDLNMTAFHQVYNFVTIVFDEGIPAFGRKKKDLMCRRHASVENKIQDNPVIDYEHKTPSQ
jgi:hypothetical protein